MGCGSEPTYVGSGRHTKAPDGLFLMHYGYARKADQKAKHERYTSLAEHGHADKHVQSIVTRPSLRRWDGPYKRMEIPDEQ